MSTFKRTAADEADDKRQYRTNVVQGAFEDWPNEAGVGIRLD